MAKPDVVLLTSITSYIVNTKNTTLGEIAEVFDLKFEDAVEAIKILFLTEVEGRENSYFVDFVLDSANTADESDLVYSPEDSIVYNDMSYDDPRVYLTHGEAAVSVQMIDQVLKLLHEDSEPAESLRSVREKIRQGTEHAIGAEPPEPRGSHDVLDAVWAAMRESKRLSFDYHSPGELQEKVTTRTVIPCAVVSEYEGYLAALQDEKELRWFRLDRMSNAKTGVPVSQTEANRARRTLKKHPDLHPTHGFEVTFTVKPGAAWFAEATPGARLVNNGDSLDITCTAVTTTWVRGCAMKLGTDLLDISPNSVKDEVVKQVKAVLEAQKP